MKKFILDFVRRGLTACGLGPIVLAILYLILHQSSVIDLLTVSEVCTGIFSLTALAFVAGGVNAIYQIERLPLMVAILIHGGILYTMFLLTYLINDWLQQSAASLLIFTGVFAAGYLVIWAIIYTIIKRNTLKLNKKLKKKQGEAY